MEIRPYRTINRKITKQIKVGNVGVGGNSPINVQSMTNTLTLILRQRLIKLLFRGGWR